MIGIRDEYRPRFGRQVLTLWSGSFYSVFDGEAVELPNHDGFMVRMDPDGERIRVTCPAPRTDDNYLTVDAALVAAAESAIGASGRILLASGDRVPATCRHCGRELKRDSDGRWVDPEADGDDVVWREVCDSHDTFTAEHEPVSV